VFGLLYAPALDDFSITLGPDQAASAQLAPHTDVRALADCGLRTIHSRTPDPLALIALTSQSHLTPETEAILAGYGVAVRRALSSSLKFALLARGEADLYPRIGPTCEWDTAAGHALLAAAGGTVTTLEGKPLLYGHAERGFENAPFIAWGREPLPRRQAGVRP
jgi:3'(2'), 5'-bisphosphate nucleotidase